MNEYDKQAQEFLESTGTTIDKKYEGHRKYFDGDKEYRSVWSITLTRKDKSYTFEFGNSIIDSYIIVGANKKYANRLLNQARKAGVSQQGGNVRVELSQKPPSDYSILFCLDTYVEDTFEEFCDWMGCTTDSRSTLNTYLDVQKQVAELRKLYNSDELKKLGNIQ